MSYPDVYGKPFDTADWFKRLLTPSQWSELFERLYHQGDVTAASYAAVPYIADYVEKHGSSDWQPYALAAFIEASRQMGRGPKMPVELNGQYDEAFQKLAKQSLEAFFHASDALIVRSLIAVLAISKGQVHTAEFAMLDGSEQTELLER